MKFLTAYQLLESTGMFKIEKVEPVNEALGEKTITATVYIRKEITKSADMRTTAGRRVYHQNARAFGISESKEDQIREAIEVVKKHGYRVMNEETRTARSTLTLLRSEARRSACSTKTL